MANNITLNILLNVAISGTNLRAIFQQNQATMAGDAAIDNVQSIGTGAETLNLGDVSTIGYTLIWNLDATNYVEIDSANSFDKFPQKIPAGKCIILAPQTTTIYAKANTGACLVRVLSAEL